MSTQCKTIQEKLEIIRKLIDSFCSPKFKDHIDDGFVDSVSGYFISIGYGKKTYKIYYGSETIFSLAYKVWVDAGVDSEDIAINGNYQFQIPPYVNESAYDKKKVLHVNSRLTQEKYNKVLKSDQIFNYMLGSNAFPTYEVIELAKGIREILHSNKQFSSIAFYIRHDLVDWDRLENTKELYVN